MSGLYLFARIAGTAVAIPTEDVEAVVRMSELSPVPGVAGYVAGLSALRSRVLTIVDAAALITGSAPVTIDEGSRENYAIVCDISGHSYGILVDGVDDIRTVTTPVLPVCGKISEVWRPYVSGAVEDEGQSFLLSLTGLLEQCLVQQAA